MDRATNLATYMQGSKAVEETGEPKRLYHATAADFSVFDPKKAAKNSGHPASRLGHFLAATPEAADLFSRKPDKFSQGTGEYKPGANIMPVHAAIKNPHVMTWKEFAGALAALNSMPDKKANKEVDAFRKSLIDAGHDGILIKGGWKPGQFLGSPEFSSDNWVAFDPTQIKSATGNQGTFDPSNPDITKASGGDVEGRNKNLAAFLKGNHPDVPKIAYHATNKDFSSFLPMSHFGTKKAAMSRLKEIDRPNHNVMPVHLSIKNPLNVGEENRTWMDNADVLNQIAEKLVHMGHPEHAARVQSISDDIMDNDPKDQTPHLTSAANILSSLGYDGIKYINKVEDRGSYSFIPLFPNQIKSAIGNQGTFDPSNPDITKRDGGDVEGPDPSIDMSIDKQNNRLSAKAIDDWNKAIGHATFNIGDNNELDPQHVEVHESHRKSGIAKKLYDHVARNGYKIIRSSDQTDAGHAFWNKHQGSNKVWQVKKRDGGDVEGEGITAYHGSPHDFEQFDTSKIGTGEGNQAYGSGLYFAQNEKVAKNYRDMLAPEIPSEGGTMADAYSLSREQHAMMDQNDLDAHFADIDDNSIEKLFRNGKTTHFFNDGSALVDEGDHLRPVKKGKGHMYEVHINAHPEHFLDWDEVLEDQSDHIKTALRRIADREEEEHGYSDLHDHFDDPYGYTGGAIYDSLSRNGHMSKKASKLLSDAGIKGIRYLDAGSRVSSEEPTHNYVVFDHNHVKVRRKYEQGGFVEEDALL